MSAKAVISVIGFLLVLSASVYFAWRIFVDMPAKEAEVDKALEEYRLAEQENQQAQQELRNTINEELLKVR